MKIMLQKGRELARCIRQIGEDKNREVGEGAAGRHLIQSYQGRLRKKADDGADVAVGTKRREKKNCQTMITFLGNQMDKERETGTKKLCSVGDVLVSLVFLIHTCTHSITESSGQQAFQQHLSIC